MFCTVMDRWSGVGSGISTPPFRLPLLVALSPLVSDR
jgi:hypothetical protein